MLHLKLIETNIGYIFMKSKQFLQLIIFCFGLFSAAPLQAAPIAATEAKTWAQDKGNLLLETFQVADLQVKYKKLDELFVQYVDLEYIGKFVVGKHWKEMTPEQQSKYLGLFKRYSLGVYKSFPLTFKDEIIFEILNADSRADYTDVSAQINLGKNFDNPSLQKIMVSFRLSKKGKEIKLIDIKLAESSLILSYRNRFYEMIANNDGDMVWFLEDLEMITKSTEQTNQTRLENQDFQ